VRPANPSADLVHQAESYTDIPRAYFSRLADAFVTAHRQAPYGLSIEIGTRIGGSALLFLLLLERLYDPQLRPMLFTIDPYGGKPYDGGNGVEYGIYGDSEFVKMKKLLARFPNHAHFFMQSHGFLELMGGAGEELAFKYHLRGAQKVASGDVSFVFLDGEHSSTSIFVDFTLLRDRKMLRPGAIVFIDNVDVDPQTRRNLMNAHGIDTAGMPYVIYEHGQK
jgi:predicted O-methyltransferase YrrM